MSKTITTLGRTERVSLPKYRIFDVPAKIDTGADSSAIWASEIVEHDGTLSFVLFDETSPYFTGERITTKEYWVVSVRNSFGQIEPRYKTALSVKLGDKVIKAQFNLADRSRSRYSILIGNATIRNKFLIDVGLHRAGTAGNSRILVLASVEGSKLAHRLVEGLKKEFGQTAEIFLSSYSSLRYQILDGRLAVTETGSGYDLADFDFVYFRTYAQFAEQAAASAEYLIAHRILFIDREVATYHSLSKLTQYVKMTLAGLPVPDSVFADANKLNYTELASKLGEPFILKDVTAEKGRSNHLIHNRQEMESILKLNPGLPYIAQRYISNKGDLRVLVFDKKVELIIGRRAADGTHLNNTSVGGVAEILPIKTLDGSTASMAVRAAVVMNRQVAGVDILFDNEAKRWYILEVNNSPQISSGSFIEEKIAAFGKFLKKYSTK